MSNHLPRYRFGNTPAMTDELAHLIKNGTKTATCSAYREYLDGDEPLPIVGQVAIVENAAGEEICRIKILEVNICRFDEVDAAFAYAEGEGNRSLTYWQNAHRQFFSQMGIYMPDMQLVCEIFSLVNP